MPCLEGLRTGLFVPDVTDKDALHPVKRRIEPSVPSGVCPCPKVTFGLDVHDSTMRVI